MFKQYRNPDSHFVSFHEMIEENRDKKKVNLILKILSFYRILKLNNRSDLQLITSS